MMDAGPSQCWNSAKKFDIRDLADPTKADEYLLQCGPNLRDIYCYKSHGSSVISKHSDYVKNIAIDFRNQREDEKPGEPSIRKILLQFRNLTRLRLKLDDDRYDYFYFIQHLPESMIEIHLLGDTYSEPEAPGYNRTYQEMRSPQEDPTSKKFLDLTKFSQLQALTLTSLKFEYGSLFGLERLMNLKYLRLDYARFDKRYVDTLKRYRKLEHLSLAFFEMSPDVLGSILKGNENLKFLNLTGQYLMSNKHLYLWKLKQLKILRLANSQLSLNRISFSSSLEYFDCSNNQCAGDADLSVLIWAFPNLKALNASDCGFSSRFISVVEKELSQRKHELSLKLHLGQSDKSLAILSQATSRRLQCSEFPDEKYSVLFDYDRWNGWYTTDEEEKTPDDVMDVMEPLADNFSPIQLLSDDCLEGIFRYLSLPEKLKIKQVCKRWQNDALGAWYTVKKLDIRDVVPHEDIQKFITSCGRYLNDLYYYKSCGLPSLPVKTPNLRNLAIDFQNRLCKCSSHNEEIDSSSFNLLLKEFCHLTRVMFRNFDFRRMHSFLVDLPETMKEIHIYDEGFFEDSDSEGVAIRIDLSKFINLRALTLTNFARKTYGDHDPVLYIDGIEQLDKLTYLRLSGDMWIECSNEPFKNIINLEHLYVKRIVNSLHITSLVRNNRNLKCLVISDLQDVPTAALDTISSLENLQHLHLSKISYSTNLWNFAPDRMAGMPSLEYLYWDSSFRLPSETLHRIVAESPNLKMVNIRNYNAVIDQLMEAAQRATRTRTSGPPLKIFLGRERVERAKHLEDVSPFVVFDDVPLIEECFLPFQDDFWEGWWTED